MEQVVDGLRLEDFLSPEISRVLQDPKSDPFSSLDQQSLTTTSNPGPSQEITDNLVPSLRKKFMMPLRRESQPTPRRAHAGATVCGWNGAKPGILTKTF